MDDIQRSWRHVDFGTGKVIFLDVTRKEDMLQVEYPNCFLLDMGWYQDRYMAGIRTDTSFLSFITSIGRIQSSSMKRQKQISFPRY